LPTVAAATAIHIIITGTYFGSTFRVTWFSNVWHNINPDHSAKAGSGNVYQFPASIKPMIMLYCQAF
jgi:hypothetical protein